MSLDIIDKRLVTAVTNKIYFDKIISIIKENLNSKKIIKILNIGCANCRIEAQLLPLLEKNKIKFDFISQDIVDLSADQNTINNLKKYNWKFKKTDKSLNKISKNYDLIIHSDVIEHLEHPYNFLKTIKNISNSKSYMIFITPNLLRFTNIIRIFLGILDFPKSMGKSKFKHVGEETHLVEYTEFYLKLILLMMKKKLL